MKNKISTSIVLGILAFSSCTNSQDVDVPNFSNATSISTRHMNESVLSAEDFGELHNDILGQLLEKSDANEINGFNDLVKQTMAISLKSFKEKGVDYSYTPEDSLFFNTLLRVYRQEVINNKENALELLILVSDYPEDVKSQMIELVRTNPDIETFVNGINQIASSQNMSRSAFPTPYSQSFSIINAMALASNDFWSERILTRASFGTYAADGLGGAAATISGVGIVGVGLAGAAASFLWEKAIEPCYSDQKKITVVAKPNQIIQISNVSGLIKAKPISINGVQMDSIKTIIKLDD